ncbi:MAG: dienelactone hydrolase family protein [Verrucomicrobia bacterium]|nr:dienelactone hydrolase family protein [Verrucomicrobiota bacterium]
MSLPTFLCSLILAVSLNGFSADGDKPKIIRSWKSSDGRELKAELLEFDAKEIKIKRMTDFQIMKVPVDKFSAEDQAFVAGLVHERDLDEGMTKGPYAEKITGTFVKSVSKQGLNYLMALIADLTSKLPIDLKRLYLTGSSMGGFGTWSLCAKYPNVFAAGVPLCGGGDPKKAESLKKVPMWVFHGDQDPMVPVERDRVAVAAVKEAGGLLIKYTEFPGVGHSLSGLVYPMPELHSWLFEQRLTPVIASEKAD